MPLKHAQRCLREFRAWIDSELADLNGIRPHFPIEIRFTEADDIWLSPGYGERMCWIGIVQYKYVRGFGSNVHNVDSLIRSSALFSFRWVYPGHTDSTCLIAGYSRLTRGS